MAARTTEAERRAKVAEACLEFGADLLRTRLSSVTAQDARAAARDLFAWFAAHDAFRNENHLVAARCVAFARALLEHRASASVGEALDSIRELYSALAD
ncbi:MAG: hypothetical protein IT578_00275 [Verrucomicrobiae bacterium]|nr:hypothetical protein [Verrucomicrobiae bacterium]